MAKSFSTQVTTNITQAAIAGLQKQLRNATQEALRKQETAIERKAENAAMQVIQALSHAGGSYSVAGKTFTFKGGVPLISGPIRRLLQDDEFIGELGIPDPDEAVRVLIKSLPLAVTIRARVFRGTIRISARFTPERLIKHNPHPGRSFPNGQKIPVESWLQWTVGPNFDTQGTPGFGLVRVNELLRPDILDALPRLQQEKRFNMAASSRTFDRAGGDAGLMLKLQPTSPGAERGQLESFSGSTGRPWRPVPAGRNFWTNWWKGNTEGLKSAFANIASAIITQVAQQELSSRK